MKHLQLMQAYQPLQKLSEMALPVKDAYAVFKLIKAIQPERDFGARREQDLLEKYGGVMEDGSINFNHGDDEAGAENARGFVREIEELHQMDVETAFEPVKIRIDVLGEQMMTASEIMALDGLIEFE